MVALASALAGCGEKRVPGVYALPPAEAMARLANADIDGFRNARQCGILIHFAQASEGPDAITWRVTSSGKPVARFTVRLAAEGQGTRATIEVPEAPKGGEIYDGSQFYPRPALNQPLRPAVQELIDAAMERRPYDVWRIPDPRNMDQVCSLQRGSLEHGRLLRVDDIPGKTPAESEQIREQEALRREREIRDFGKPMMRPGAPY